MARTSTYHARAIVLRSRIIGEKDRVMTLLSPEIGKFDAVAKGARNPKSKLAAVSQPFTRARFLVARGRSLDIATQAEIEEARTHISGDLLRSAWSSYACELCCAVPERQPDEELFLTLDCTLENFDDTARDHFSLDLCGHWFEARFLSLLGYAPQIGTCVVSGEKIIAPREDANCRVLFSPQLGGNISREYSQQDPQHMTVLASSLRVLHTLMRSETPPLEIEMTTLCRRDLSNVLKRLVTAHLDIRPRSRKFLEEISADLATE
jgi:DNA repair protein RecO (recombination protein O)